MIVWKIVKFLLLYAISFVAVGGCFLFWIFCLCASLSWLNNDPTLSVPIPVWLAIPVTILGLIALAYPLVHQAKDA